MRHCDLRSRVRWARVGQPPVRGVRRERRRPGHRRRAGALRTRRSPKAGVFAEGQASVVARRVAAAIRGEATESGYDGRGICYLEFGHDMIAKVDVTFVSGQRPVGSLVGPSTDLVSDKTHFGSSRVRRWFGHEWER